MAVRNFKELVVWQKAMDLAEMVYTLTHRFPREEVYGLTSQLRRSAVSVPSNIAEGQARSSTAEFRNFLSIARGSLAEVETQLLLAQRFNYLEKDDLEPALGLQEEVAKMINALRKSLKEGGR